MINGINNIKIFNNPENKSIQIIISFERYYGSLPGMVNRANNVSTYFENKYNVNVYGVSHMGGTAMTLFLPKNRIDVATAFKLEFG